VLGNSGCCTVETFLSNVPEWPGALQFRNAGSERLRVTYWDCKGNVPGTMLEKSREHIPARTRNTM